MGTPLATPRARRRGRSSRTIAATAEILAAIGLVARRSALVVRLSGLPDAERVAARGAGWAMDAGVAFRVVRSDAGRATIVVGPLVDAAPAMEHAIVREPRAATAPDPA